MTRATRPSSSSRRCPPGRFRCGRADRPRLESTDPAHCRGTTMRFIDSDADIRMIVMWSGGIDSTFKLAYLLKETEYQVHAHHVHIVNREGRSQAERAACVALRSKLKAIRSFAYTESRIDHRQHAK